MGECATVPITWLTLFSNATTVPWIHKYKMKGCIEASYGTQVWQVADSLQKNEIFKIKLAKAKEIYI